MVEIERLSFDEQHYAALRRLLRLPALEVPPEPNLESGVPWVEDGVEVPHGSLAQMEYFRGSQVYEGRFLNGRLVVSGIPYSTLSAAADAHAKTKNGSSTSLNGWRYWQVQFPGEAAWRSLHEMRKSKRKS